LKIGFVNIIGEVRDRNSKKLGTIKDGTVVNAYLQTIFKYDQSTIRDGSGRLIYRFTSDSVRNSSGQLLIKYEEIELTVILAFLCFLYSDI